MKSLKHRLFLILLFLPALACVWAKPLIRRRALREPDGYRRKKWLRSLDETTVASLVEVWVADWKSKAP